MSLDPVSNPKLQKAIEDYFDTGAENRYKNTEGADPFARFKFHCANSLTKDNVKLFKDFFNIPSGRFERILDSDAPGMKCMEYLQNFCCITTENIDNLLDFTNKNIVLLNADFVAHVHEYNDMFVTLNKKDNNFVPESNAPAPKAKNRYVNTEGADPFARFKFHCANSLTKDNMKLFKDFFNIPSGRFEEILDSDAPGMKYMEYLQNFCYITAEHIDKLLDFTNKNIDLLDANFVTHVYEYNDMLNMKA